MRNTTLLITVSIFIILFSCKKKEKEVEHDYLETIIDKVNVTNNIKWIVLLPGLGCHGCIQEGEAFMKKSIMNRDVLFILTKIESFKILQNKLEIKLSEHPNVYIDKKNQFKIPSNNSVYPCIIEIKKGKVIKHEFQSPNNAQAFENLKSKINTPY